MYFICLAHSLQCLVNEDAATDPVPTDCKGATVCTYCEETREPGNIAITRTCLPKVNEKMIDTMIEGKCNLAPQDKNCTTLCVCDTDNCNHECSPFNCPEGGTKCDANGKAPEEVPEENETKPTGSTNANETKPYPTDDISGATSEDGPQPTDDISGDTSQDGPQPTADSSNATGEDGQQPTKDSPGATGEDGPQPTGDGAGATVEDAEEKKRTTGKAARNSGNLRVVVSDQCVSAVWIHITLIIRSLY